VSPVRYELGSYIPEDDILDSHRRENLKSHIGRILMGRYPRRGFHSKFYPIQSAVGLSLISGLIE
jgi:hypothetical protein